MPASRHFRPLEPTEIDDIIGFDQPAPRYTSYPTAAEFQNDIDPQVYGRFLDRARQQQSSPLSMYVHLPFCEERCHFCGCHVVVSPDRGRARPYIQTLIHEADLLAERLGDRRALNQLHLGGGTPTYFSADDLSYLVGELQERFPVLSGAELAVEVDPRVTTVEQLGALADHGFNRLSIGIQDTDPRVQDAIGRRQDLGKVRELVAAARRFGYGGINADLIYGLPNQTYESFGRTIETVIHLGFDRVALYSFALLPTVGRRNQEKIDTSALPTTRDKLALFLEARHAFLSSGYQAIGMDHFARLCDPLTVAKGKRRLHRNFQGYTSLQPADVVGLGVSAIGDVQGLLVQNEKKLSTWTRAVESGVLPAYRGVRLTREDRLRRDVIQSMMCYGEIVIGDIEEKWSVDFAATFGDALDKMRPYLDQGLASWDRFLVRATPKGQLLVRNLAACFDTYRGAPSTNGKRVEFSRAI